jgi:hypothetical protein
MPPMQFKESPKSYEPLPPWMPNPCGMQSSYQQASMRHGVNGVTAQIAERATLLDVSAVVSAEHIWRKNDDL